jgi:uncharacterized membrane protein YhaH (DUF805 family)
MQKPISYWITMATCILLGAACLSLAYLSDASRRSHDLWLFVAFGVLFLVPPIAMLLQRLRERPETAAEQEVVFAQHWHVVSAAVIFLLIVLASVVAAITA